MTARAEHSSVQPRKTFLLPEELTMSVSPITITKAGIGLDTDPTVSSPIVIFATGSIAINQTVVVQQTGSTLAWSGTISQLLVSPNVWLAMVSFSGTTTLLRQKSSPEIESVLPNVFTITILDDANDPISNSLPITINPYDE